MEMPNLYFIKELQPYDKGIKTTLKNRKVVILLKSNKFYEYYSKLLMRALKRKHPVGLTISKDSEILRVKRADNDFIEMTAKKDEKTYVIQFQGHDGIFYLECDHPGFDKIYTILERSRIDSRRIWFISQHPRLRILDVILA